VGILIVAPEVVKLQTRRTPKSPATPHPIFETRTIRVFIDRAFAVVVTDRAQIYEESSDRDSFRDSRPFDGGGLTLSLLCSLSEHPRDLDPTNDIAAGGCLLPFMTTTAGAWLSRAEQSRERRYGRVPAQDIAHSGRRLGDVGPMAGTYQDHDSNFKVTDCRELTLKLVLRR